MMLTYYNITEKVTLYNLLFTTHTHKHNIVLKRVYFKMKKQCKILDILKLTSIIIIIIKFFEDFFH